MRPIYLLVECDADELEDKYKSLSFAELREVLLEEAKTCDEPSIKACDVFETRPVEANKKLELQPGQCPSCYGCGNVMISHANTCSACNGTGRVDQGGSHDFGCELNNTTTTDGGSILPDRVP